MRTSLVALALVAHACGDGGAAGDAPRAITDTPSTTTGLPAAGAVRPDPPRPGAAAPAITYPDSAQGLARLAADLLAALRVDDDRRLAALLESLRLRDPERWFEQAFGRTLGRELADEYRPLRDEIGHLTAVLEGLVAADQSEVTVERFDREEDRASVGYQSAALAKMAQKTALYSLRFATADATRTFHLWSFVYQDGSFRYVGKMKRAVETPPSGDRDLLELRLADAERLRSNPPR